MSRILRTFAALIDFSKVDDYKSQYLVMAMAIRKDGVIVYSSNGATTVPAQDRLKVKVAHAEQRISRKIDTGAEVYVARLFRTGEWALSKPCKSCETMLRARGVRRVYYTIAEHEYGVLDWK